MCDAHAPSTSSPPSPGWHTPLATFNNNILSAAVRDELLNHFNVSRAGNLFTFIWYMFYAVVMWPGECVNILCVNESGVEGGGHEVRSVRFGVWRPFDADTLRLRCSSSVREHATWRAQTRVAITKANVQRNIRSCVTRLLYNTTIVL